MKRILPLLLAALLAIGATGCRASDPKENKTILGDIANAPTDPANAPTQHKNVPSDCRIGPKALTSGEEYLVDLVTTDAVSLFSYKANPEWRDVSIWVEPYFKGERQPSIEMGGMIYNPGDAVEGDLMVKIARPVSGLPTAYQATAVFANDGAKYSSHPSDAIDVGEDNGYGFQMLTEPVEILEGRDIILRIDTFSSGMMYAMFDPYDLDADRLATMDYVFVYKCKFAKPVEKP